MPAPAKPELRIYTPERVATLTQRARRQPASLGSSFYYLEPGTPVFVLSSYGRLCRVSTTNGRRIPSEDVFEISMDALKFEDARALTTLEEYAAAHHITLDEARADFARTDSTLADSQDERDEIVDFCDHHAAATPAPIASALGFEHPAPAEKWTQNVDTVWTPGGEIVCHPINSADAIHRARLVAAAPQLAYELEDLANAYDALLKAYGKPFGWGTIQTDSARAALRAARPQ